MKTSPSMHSRAASVKQARFAEPSVRPKHGKAPGDRRRTDTRTHLAAATIEIIDASGWPSVTPGAVAETCLISTPAIYKHFPDKATLFETAQEEIPGRLDALAGATAHRSPVDSIFDVGERLIAYSEEYPDLLGFALFGPSSNNMSAVDTGAGARWELLAFVHREIRRLVESQPLPSWRSADETKRDLFVSLWSFTRGYSKFVAPEIVRHRSTFLKAALRSALSIMMAQISDEEAPSPAEGAQAAQAEGGGCADKK